MKLKSLLLGSAAALALSTGAQAADPIANFVSLGVCDAYGISGLTIESDDTCLKISGKVAYEYRVRHVDATSPLAGVFPSGTAYDVGEGVDWNLRFDAVTQTDAGAARAVLRLAEDGRTNNVIFDRAYVQFGDTTVLTAGRNASIFDTDIVTNIYGSRHEDFIDFWNFDNNEVDKGFLTNSVRDGGEVIQIESLIADGFSVLVALEDLRQNPVFIPAPVDPRVNARGTLGLGVAYDANGISAEAGVLIGDLYDNVAGYDPVNYYIRASANFDNFTVRGGFIADDTGDWIASIGADATFDMFSISADGAFKEAGDWFVGVEGSFAATDAIDVFLGATFEEDFKLVGETWSVYGGVEAGVTENISARAQVGYLENNLAGDFVYGEIGAAYKPGGGFEAALDLTATTEGDYQVTFSTSKSF